MPCSAVLPREQRLVDPAGFTFAVRSGARAGGPLLVVHLVQGTPGSGARVGFIVSKAVGSAVVRNRVKRRLRHLVHDLVVPLAPGAVLVVRAQPGAAEATYAELRAELERCLRRAASQRSASRAPAIRHGGLGTSKEPTR